MRETNPPGRIPSLMLEDGTVLIDSAAILDWLDETVGPARALLPHAGSERPRAMRLLALSARSVDTHDAPASAHHNTSATPRSPGSVGQSGDQREGTDHGREH